MKKILAVGLMAVLMGVGLVRPVVAAYPSDRGSSASQEETPTTKAAFCDSPDVDPVDKAAAGCDVKTLCEDTTMDEELRKLVGCEDDRNRTVFSIIETLIQVVLSLFGVIAVGVIIYGAIIYVTSTGEAAKTTKARNIILYGVVGLIVALLAFALVRFVAASIFG